MLALALTGSRQGAQVGARGAAGSGTLHGVIYAAIGSGPGELVAASRDGGITWQEADNGLPFGVHINGLAPAPGSLQIIYAATDEGIFRSTDGGDHWRSAYGGTTVAASSTVGLIINPSDVQQVSAATRFGAMLRSYDGGQSWQSQPAPTNETLTVLALDPLRPSTLALGTDGDGIYLSTDGGAAWTQAAAPNVTVYGMAFSPSAPDVAVAATDGGIYQSIDGGQTWQQDGNGLPLGAIFSAVAVDPRTPAAMVAGTSDGSIYRSQSGGTTWAEASTLDAGPVHALLYDPANPSHILAGTGSDLYSSLDGGQAWLPLGGIAATGVTALAATARGALPSDPVPAPVRSRPGLQYFPTTHHIVSGAFLTFYSRYGGLKVFGLPLTEPFVEGGVRVQYFERARMALLPGGGVRLGPLGREFTAGRVFPPVAPFRSTANDRYFPATGYDLSGRFLTFWNTHHGSLVLGPPISEPFYEQNGDGTGRTYLLQYFANGRLEYHPELTGTGFEVQIGQLGRLILHQRGWL
jgi:photosystem II stability/assembly factor-like uncharacterized protein